MSRQIKKIRVRRRRPWMSDNSLVYQLDTKVYFDKGRSMTIPTTWTSNDICKTHSKITMDLLENTLNTISFLAECYSVDNSGEITLDD